MLLLVGQGPVRQKLIDLAAEKKLTNIVFGDSPFNEMAQLMSVTYASLVVMKDIPAADKMRLSKTFPPLACGVPVIYAGYGESADMVREHGCGICTTPEKPVELAKAIEQLADDPERRAELGRNGVALIERELSWKAIIDNWLKQLQPSRAQCRKRLQRMYEIRIPFMTHFNSHQPPTIAVFGLGYVGTVSACCLADAGNRVIGVEVVPEKIAALNRGEVSFMEPGLEEMVRKVVASGNLRATDSSLEAVAAADLSLICVGTPSASTGLPKFEQLYHVCQLIGTALKTKDEVHTVVIRSTVLPGTVERCAEIVAEASGKQEGRDFSSSCKS